MTSYQPLISKLLAPDLTNQQIAVLVPCHNEAAAIAKVVADFKQALPDAFIYVYDNNSTDDTCRCAMEAGARVCHEYLQGKGHVVRRMFADIDADIYVLVDGDDTYDASVAPRMIHQLLEQQLDMVTGVRQEESVAAYRPGHRWGNRLFTNMVASTFGNRVHDIFSGYRVMSRRFVKSFPVLSKGFEIETEMTVHALEMQMPLGEHPTPYRARPVGSESKLSTYRDGLRILRTLLLLVRDERPLQFFSSLFILFECASLFLGMPIVLEFLNTGLVPRVPTAILSSGLALCGFLALTCGLILDTVTRGRREFKRLHYLQLKAPKALPGEQLL